jgi:hypothetical protein
MFDGRTLGRSQSLLTFLKEKVLYHEEEND